MDEQRSDDATPERDSPVGGETPQGDSPVGGDETTEDQLEADNAVEQDTLATLDPDNPPA